MNFEILESLKSEIPELREEEKVELERKLLAEGFDSKKYGSLIVAKLSDGRNILADGHNRYELCTKHNIEFSIEYKEFKDIDSIKVWMWINQFAKRNLSEQWISYYIGKLYKAEKKEVGYNQHSIRGDHSDHPSKTSEKIAKDKGISAPTVRRNETFSDNVDKIIEETGIDKNFILGGNLTKEDVNILAKKDVSEIRKVLDMVESGESKTVKDAIKEVVKEERKENEKKLYIETEINNDFLSIHNVDFREHCKSIEDNSVDLILTDPPYPSEFLTLWKDLSAIAKRVLKPNGFLIAYSGQLHLNKVMNYLDENLSYYWMFALKHTGGNQLIHPRNIFCGWKPLLVYQKEIKKVDFQIEDFITGTGREKDLHDWQQSEIEIYDIIQRFTKPNETILDPFMGSGTTGSASLKLKRKFIGCEIDKDHFEKSKVRLNECFK